MAMVVKNLVSRKTFTTNLFTRQNQSIKVDISILQVDETDQQSAVINTTKKRKFTDPAQHHFLGVVECKSHGVDTAVFGIFCYGVLLERKEAACLWAVLGR